MIASYARSMMLAIADNDELSLDDDDHHPMMTSYRSINDHRWYAALPSEIDRP